MPGRLFLTTPVHAVAQAVRAGPAAPAMPPRWNIAPGQELLVCAPGRRLAAMRWGLIPVGRKNARGRPVMETIVNARAETVFDKSAFDGLRRCIVPADGWYEWTGERRNKTPWRITRRDGALLLFAGIYDTWRAPGGQELRQVATLTCAPNAEVAEVHHRMGVILDPAALDIWLDGRQEDAAALMHPLPEGLLRVQEAAGVDWDGP